MTATCLTGRPGSRTGLDGAAWFPDRNGGLYRIGLRDNAVTGPYPLDAGNPFTLAAYAGRLWIADFAGTDVIIVDPAKLPVFG